MAENHLTTPQIDAILSIFRRCGNTYDESDIESYDLSNPHRIPHPALDALRVRHEQAAARISARLRAQLGVPVTVELEDFEQYQFGAWRDNLPSPCCAMLVDMTVLKDPAVLVVEHDLAFAGIDRLLGGTGQAHGVARDLTSTEMAVLKEFMTPVVEANADAWKIFATLRGEIVQQVSLPHFIREVAADEAVLGVSYRLKGFCDGALLRFAIPISGLEAHLQGEPRMEMDEKDAERARESMAATLLDVEVGLSVLVGRTNLELGSLVDLDKGDVLLLDRGAGERFELVVEDQPRFGGHLMRRGKSLVFKIETCFGQELEQGEETKA